MGPPAEAFLRAAAAAGQTRLPAHLADIVALEAAHGRDTLTAALERALLFRRFTSDDASAPSSPPDRTRRPRPSLALRSTRTCRGAPSRDLDAYALDQLRFPEASP